MKNNRIEQTCQNYSLKSHIFKAIYKEKENSSVIYQILLSIKPQKTVTLNAIYRIYSMQFLIDTPINFLI